MVRPAHDHGDALDKMALVASAMAGRTLEVAAAAEGDRSWCDGTTVFLEGGTDRRERIQMLAVQASLVACGSLDPAVLEGLVHRPRLARRYLAVEGARALRANEAVLPPVARHLMDPNLVPSVTSPDASMALARRRSVLPDPPRAFGMIDARRAVQAMRRAVPVPLARPSDVARPHTGAPAAELRDLDDGQGSDLGDMLSSPVGGGGAIGRLLAKILSSARRRGGEGTPGADAPSHKAFSTPSAAASRPEMSNPGVLEPGTAGGSGTPGLTYAEWDVARGAYRAGWCTVVEAGIPPDRSAIMARSEGLAESLRRSLARLGMGLTPCRRQPQGTDIDVDAAVESYLDTVAGVPAGGDVYIDGRRRRRDLGVLILLDISGSAGEPGLFARSVHEHQRLAAMALTEALHALGDRVGLCAFNSRGRQAVQYFRMKDFDERLDETVAKRLAALRPAAYTRMGAAIRHATDMLEGRSGTPRRLLVVLSDGFAYDHGYQGRYGEADARMALTEARRKSVGCVCLSIGATTDPAALRRVFGPAAHATVSRPDDLPPLIAPLFRRALRSAEGQHRDALRRARSRERLQLLEEHA